MGPEVRRDDVKHPSSALNSSTLQCYHHRAMNKEMRDCLTALIQSTAVAAILCAALPHLARATGTEPEKEPLVDPAPCITAAAANDDERIVAVCGALIDNEKTAKGDRIKALTARAGVFTRSDQTGRAIADYDSVLWLDPTLADIYNSRGELWRKTGDRRKALTDFAAALKLNPDHAVARSNYKALALELERLGALMAIYNKPSFNCAKASRAVEKAICANPELANLDREINAVNNKVVQRATTEDPRAGRALQHEQDEFLARRNAGFDRPDFDLLKAMRERLDHLLAIERGG
jgi:tetratricopeptide (TPR) repeat protein